jgi:hypothetical protein
VTTFSWLASPPRQELARDRLEAEAADIEAYRGQVVARAKSSGQVEPQLLAFVQGTSCEEIDRTAALAAEKTAEIVAELAGQRQGEPTAQARDERTGRFLPGQPDGQARDERGPPADLTHEEYAAAQNGGGRLLIIPRGP